MTDRELLESAAKASGIDGEWEEHPDYAGVSTSGIYVEGRAMLWNPIVDDGDALRLAVKLEIFSGYSDFGGNGTANWHRGNFSVSEYGPDDPCAAVRRAIVRAAAAMAARTA